MIVSFIGSTNKARCFARLFENRKAFTIGGFYASPIEDCLELSVMTNSCLFTSIDDLCHASDVIFIATDDESVPPVVHTLSKLHINNKIFVCSTSQAYGTDLDNGYENTTINMQSFFDAEEACDDEICDWYFAVNGMGKRFGEFTDALESCGIKYSILSRPELDLFRAGMTFIQSGATAITTTAKRLCKIATGSDDADITPYIKRKADFLSEGCTPSEKETEQLEYAAELLEEMGIDSISNLFGAITYIHNEQNGKC